AFMILNYHCIQIHDEPSNHLDVDKREWLYDYLKKINKTLLMVTHDRYFLDRICSHIIEMEGGNMYHHKGNYQYFLEKRAERREIERRKTHKTHQLDKKELQWMRRTPKARTTKSNAHN